MKELNHVSFVIVPPFILVLLAGLWRITDFVGIAVLLIVFWISWRQLVKKFNGN